MNHAVTQISDMSVEFIAMTKLAVDKDGGKKAAAEAKYLFEEISRLSLEVPISELSSMEQKIHQRTVWISNDPAAQA